MPVRSGILQEAMTWCTLFPNYLDSRISLSWSISVFVGTLLDSTELRNLTGFSVDPFYDSMKF